MDEDAYRKVVCGRVVPKDTVVSFQVDEGMLVPVVWSLGPAFCGYCKFKSRTFQSLSKHLQTNHAKEIKDQGKEVLLHSLVCPLPDEGSTWTFEIPKEHEKGAESMESCSKPGKSVTPPLQQKERVEKKRRAMNILPLNGHRKKRVCKK